MNTIVLNVDYNNPQHAQDLVFLLNSYAASQSGGGESLSEYARNHLVTELAKLPQAFSLLCYVNNQPAGLANCFTAFSTFKCKPLVNVHDVIVAQDFRQQGISQLLLKEIERRALDMGACKLTLEVLEHNQAALKAYAKFGFSPYEMDPAFGKALFFEKSLSDFR